MICVDKVVAEKSLDDSIQEMTLIHHYFGGCLQSQVKCIQCLHESNQYEPMMDLLVDIQGNVKSVEDALAEFTDIELLDGANKYKCDQQVHLDPGLYKVGKGGLQMAHPDRVTCCEGFAQRDGDHAPSTVQRIVILVYYYFSFYWV
ncbi:unnamed protein product [Sphagnum jensenii]|uniref:Uncharacterized protein n=1 Tax=Sphagnum jensenii TaxID=128206 RepID=A0ABP0X3T8_9BRYO